MEKRLNIIYNLKHLVIVPIGYKELFESINYTFNNAIIMENNIDDVNLTIQFINQNNIGDIIFVDYFPDYGLIMNGLEKKHQYKILFTKTLASLSNIGNYEMFQNIIKLCCNKTISSVGIVDPNMYEVLKKKLNAFQILLNVGEQPQGKKEFNTVGLLNIQDNDYHSFYNELSAVKQVDKIIAKIRKPGQTTKEFIRQFNIPTVIDDDNTIGNNCLNLNINFTELCIHNFLKSMNMGIPCIIGNNSFLNDELKEYLMVKSDDNIDEISEKIKNAFKNKDKIMKYYNKFKNAYDKKATELLEAFLGYKKEESKEKKYEKLLSVIVPVYNVEKYLEKSLNSIIAASIDNMEILVINDGSSDDSEKIIKKFEKDYPDLVRYIKKSNGGLGSVRNVGLKEARGKYIASVDSDDTINHNFFIEAEKYLKEDIDLVIYDWLSIKENNESFETTAIEWSLRSKNKYEGLLFSSIMPSTCNKIMKKSIIDSLKLEYIEDKYEDLSLNPLFMLKVKTIKYINKPYYEYYLRSGSLMRSSAGYSMIYIIQELNNRLNKLKNINLDLDEFKYYTFSWRIEEYIINQLYSIEESEIDKYIESIYKNLYNICLDVFDSQYYKKMLNSLSDKELVDFIDNRNKALKSKKLRDFILKSRKKNNIKKLSPAIIYYGDKQ